jgi:hypothetical protein
MTMVTGQASEFDQDVGNMRVSDWLMYRMLMRS